MFGLVELADDRREILGMFSDKKYNADFCNSGLRVNSKLVTPMDWHRV